MDPERKLIARKMFKLRVHQAKGSAYQELFEQVMQYRFQDFTPIHPYGNQGDRKNDGYIRSQGRYFQVYAPDDPENKRSHSTAALKARLDFAGLKAFWNDATPIRDFRFAFNDEYTGSPPALEKTLAKIRTDHRIEAAAFLAKDLELEALSLAQDELIDVIGTPIPESGLLATIDFGILREVVIHVLDIQTPFTPDSILTAPDFGQKISFNGLSTQVAALLTVGSYQSDAVKDYFSKNSTFARQELRDQLSSLYATSRQSLEDFAEPNAIGDLVFFDLLKRLTPLRNASSRQQALSQNAAIVVMAYYFEACDIFEDPNAAA